MSDWNFADVWERVALLQPDLPAVLKGDEVRSWSDLDRRADALARRLLDAGLGHQAKVAQYLHNGPEYVEALFACFKASLVPVNTNYRYVEAELVYLWRDADVEAVRARVGDSEPFDGGFLTRDPWGTAVAFVRG